MSFYITLPSDSSTKYFPNNTTSKFRTYLPEVVKLTGSYEVALTEISYPRTWNNVKEDSTIRIWSTDAKTLETLVVIPKGSFLSIYDFLEILRFTDNSIKFTYTASLKRVAIFMDHNYTINIPGDIAVMLGFTLDPKKNFVVTESILAPYIVDMDAGLHSVFVYSDVVTNTIVGDSKAPLLRIISAKGKDGETVDTEFSRPHYMPVASSEIQTIEINIMDELGNPIRFERGKIHVTLHFRPRRTWLTL